MKACIRTVKRVLFSLAPYGYDPTDDRPKSVNPLFVVEGDFSLNANSKLQLVLREPH